MWPTLHRSTPIIIIESETFTGESIELDDKQFIDCTFTNCVLEYHGGEVIFDRTQLDRCRHVFYGRARQTLRYLQGVGLMPFRPSEWGEFPDQIH